MRIQILHRGISHGYSHIAPSEKNHIQSQNVNIEQGSLIQAQQLLLHLNKAAPTGTP